MRARIFVVAIVGVLSVAGGQAQSARPAAPSVSGELIVKFRNTASAANRADAHRLGRGTLRAAIRRRGVELVAVPPGEQAAALARYRANPDVLYAEPNYIRRIPKLISHTADTEVMPGDFYFDEQWGLHNVGQMFQCFPWPFPPPDELCYWVGTPDADIDAPEAWAIAEGDPAIRVAVIDSGVDYTHPDLAGAVIGGYDYVSNDANPMDDHGHGTHVAGIVGAALNNPTGDPAREEGVVGVAPGVSLLAYKVCSAGGECTDFAIQQAIAQAIVDGAKVVNLSIGDPVYSRTLDDAVQDAWNAGLVFVAGAGNEGTTAPFYPAALPNVVSVAAFDEDHNRPDFSTYSNTWVDISAPGNAVMSTYPVAACGGPSNVPGDTGCYEWLTGTSMATPHVSGAAAMIWARGDVTTNAQVVEILLESANPGGVGQVPLGSWTIHGGLNLHDALSYGVTNQPPVADAGADQSVTDSDGSGAENVTLDGTGSHDPNGSIVSHDWSQNGTPVASGATPTLLLAVGSHVLTLEVTDNGGQTDTDTVLVTVNPQADTVTILKATYNTRRRQLTVEATSSAAPGAILTVYEGAGSTLTAIGQLTYNSKKRKYAGTFNVSTRPATITVLSSEGGSATGPVS